MWCLRSGWFSYVVDGFAGGVIMLMSQVRHARLLRTQRLGRHHLRQQCTVQTVHVPLHFLMKILPTILVSLLVPRPSGYVTSAVQVRAASSLPRVISCGVAIADLRSRHRNQHSTLPALWHFNLVFSTVRGQHFSFGLSAIWGQPLVSKLVGLLSCSAVGWALSVR